MPNNAFKSLATLTRTFSTPRLLGHGFAMLPEQSLHAERRLTLALGAKKVSEKIGILDVVEIVATSPVVPEASVGERGAVVVVHEIPQGEKAFEIECVLPNGEAKWQGTFTTSQIKLVSKA